MIANKVISRMTLLPKTLSAVYYQVFEACISLELSVG